VTPDEFFRALNYPAPSWAGWLRLDRLRQRFEKKVPDGDDGCLEWLAYRAPNGYGKFGIGRGLVLGAHKVAYVLAGGTVSPERPHVLHRCDNPPCVNPQCLWAGTCQDNMKDCWDKGRSALVSLKGDAHPRAKVTSEMEARIHQLRGEGLTQQRIAEIVGINQPHVSKVLRGVHRVPVLN
jgi:predicted XRE-type DNA-binding protein